MELPSRRPSWPLRCLLLLCLPAWPGAGAQGQNFELRQPQVQVSAMAGETLTLTCTVSKTGPLGPVRWLKGWGSTNQTVYDQRAPPPRVMLAQNGSNTDFTILIRDVRPEDAGTYYCVKFRKTSTGDEVYQRGNGTEVSVLARPSEPAVSGPSRRAVPGQSVPFTCTAGGFYPKDIQVRWLRNKVPIQTPQPRITPEPSKSSFHMSSTVEVTLREDDVRSELTCEVQHPTLPSPLRGTYGLGQVLRVPPRVSVVAVPPGAVEMNRTVNFTCHVLGFYPGAVNVTWLENGTELSTGSTPQPTETPQGLFELRSSVTVQAVEEKNGSRLSCRVLHEEQEPISSTATLWVAAPAQKEPISNSLEDSRNLIYIAVGVVCTVLALLVLAILYLIRTKQNKGKGGKSSPSARLHEPEKSSGTGTQESDPNNLTYADLNFTKEKKSIRRIIELSQQSEYACIQGSQAPASNDNLTYADLDMVHLSKAPRRPPPRPDDSSSEYASVQIQRP